MVQMIETTKDIFGGIPIYLYESPYERQLLEYDAEVMAYLRGSFPHDRNPVSYIDVGERLLPDVFRQKQIIEDLTRQLDIGPIEDINYAGLQHGQYGVHHRVQVSGTYGSADIVSYTSRYPKDHLVGHKARIDFTGLKGLSDVLARRGSVDDSIVSVVEPLLYTHVSHNNESYPLFFTRMDTLRGELHASTVWVKNKTKYTPILVPRYAVPYTLEMTIIHNMQRIWEKMVSESTVGDGQYNEAVSYVNEVWKDLARSFAVLASVTGSMPKDYSINDGDAIGLLGNGWNRLNPKDIRLSHVKLTSVKGGLVPVDDTREIFQVLRSYMIREEDPKGMYRSFGLFSSISDQELLEVVSMCC